MRWPWEWFGWRWRWELPAEWREETDWRQGRERDEAWHTGQWISPYARDVIEIRWDPVIRMHFVDGVAWPHLEVLRMFVLRLETELGWVPKTDNATRAIRARLDLPGWETGGGP